MAGGTSDVITGQAHVLGDLPLITLVSWRLDSVLSWKTLRFTHVSLWTLTIIAGSVSPSAVW
jgi:hypothetical protein